MESIKLFETKIERKATYLIIGALVLAVIFFTASYFVAKDADSLPRQDGLPEPVEAKRQEIYKAAMSRDYEALDLAAPEDIHYSFGGDYEGGFIAYLKLSEQTEGKSPFEIIPTILRLPYAKQGDIYAWPYMHYKNPSGWTEEDIALMKTFLTDELIESYKQFGGYLFYRIGINEDGKWLFYIAGD